MKCICGKEIDESLVMVDINLGPSHVPVCSVCFNLWANHEYDELTKRIKDNPSKTMKKEMIEDG